MAISSYKVFLMESTDGESYKKLIDIKSFPNLGGTPDLLETTTLSDPVKTNILGIQSLDALEFTCNYTLEDYQKLNNVKGQEKFYAVWFGGTETAGKAVPVGDQGKFSFKGALSVFANGAGVNEVVDMTVSIANSTPIAFNGGLGA